MKWKYTIHWPDGARAEFFSSRLSRVSADTKNLVLYINKHGDDGRFDEVCIPLGNVRYYVAEEVL